jgi:methylated-DNA-[protein]-cysteine S-methyltransferase
VRSSEGLQFAWIDSPVGQLLAGASPVALQVLEFDASADAYPVTAQNAVLEQTRHELGEYFAGLRRTFDVNIELHGSPFQLRVWNALRSIGYGKVISYLEQSRWLHDEKAIRAVAQANGQNPIAIIVPCHRVVNADGGLGGYGGGLLRKQFLLDLERGDRLL